MRSYTPEKQAYDEQGFTIVRGLLDDVELKDLQDHLERYIREVVPTLPDADAFYEDRDQPETLKQLQHMGGDPFFLNYGQHPKWKALAETLVGEPLSDAQPEWFNKPPGTRHVTPPHQDNYYFCLKPPNVVTIWLALDTVDAENGCLRYLSGSHLQGFRPHAQSKILGFSQGITAYSADDFSSEVAVPLQAGDAVAHHGMTIHRADANMSATRHRRALAMVCKGVSCERDEEAFERYQQMVQKQHQQVGMAKAGPNSPRICRRSASVGRNGILSRLSQRIPLVGQIANLSYDTPRHLEYGFGNGLVRIDN
jgi:phytanoyl-CoA hydroxylase